MKFDDFNYEVYNPYILVVEDKEKDGDKKGGGTTKDGKTELSKSAD